MKARLEVLWRHYSSWMIYAIIGIGGLQEFVPDLSEYLPKQIITGIAVAALIAKLIPQTKRKEV